MRLLYFFFAISLISACSTRPYVHKPEQFNRSSVDFAKKVNKLIVITRGEKGALAINGEKITVCTAKKNLKIKDLTGAGDLFAGGFLHGYVNNKSLKDNFSDKVKHFGL